ncbi:hypothetical protein [Zoogloea sp.]|uniref:hypothetical protein n=1 Tax=Zoogloea sp. TaxID=49181 RepID=UPI0025884728|nr:hypothetical protein [Zoogloea sp.]MDD2670111.1 hypothetical protein [Zoogloea sp.]
MKDQPVQQNGGMTLLLWVLVLLLSVGGVHEYQRRQERAKQQHVEDLRRQAAEKVALDKLRLEREEQARKDAEERAQDALRRQRDMRMQELNRLLQPLTAATQRFNDAMQLAASTPRINLAGPVQQMQQIARETAAIKVDGCLELPYLQLLSGMEDAVQGFLAFMRNEPDLSRIQRAQEKIMQWQRVVELCKKAMQ